MVSNIGSGPNDLSSALAFRLRDIARMVDRLDRLESGTGEWLATQHPDDWLAAATEMTLRAFRTAADPMNFAILRHLSEHTSVPISDLEQAIGLVRLALNERVNDLVQIGLAARHIDTDHVQGTTAGTALVGLITGISQTTAKKLIEALQPVTR